MKQHPVIDDEVPPRYISHQIGAEEDDHIGDLAGFTDPTQRNLLKLVVAHPRDEREEVVCHVATHAAAVHPDMELTPETVANVKGLIRKS
jgi:hypothetical protein